MPNYKVYVFMDEKGIVNVKVGSTYAGVPVWGIAKCAPEDTFDYKFGYDLAKARCDIKIAKKRYKRASQQVEDINQLVEEVKAYQTDKNEYLRTAEKEYYEALGVVNKYEIVGWTQKK